MIRIGSQGAAIAEQVQLDLLTSDVLRPSVLSGEIPDAVQRSFQGATFNDGMLPEYPLSDISEKITLDTGGMYVHAISRTKEGLAGGMFGIPRANRWGSDTTSIGWYFTVPELGLRQRAYAVRGMLGLTATHLAGVGFTHIQTSMGTVAGGRAMKRLGFVQEPAQWSDNNWVLDLSPYKT